MSDNPEISPMAKFINEELDKAPKPDIPVTRACLTCSKTLAETEKEKKLMENLRKYQV